MIKRLNILTILLAFALILNAQKDTILELGFNNKLKSYYNLNKDNPNAIFNKKSTNNKAVLSLPFIDDFSQNHIYPNQGLWQNIDVHINSNFADNPITYGVATFDGLDFTGYPYNFSNPTAHGAADTLTSQPIDLSSVTDSVFLSFYYQPQGLGNKPQYEDSLRLEFYRASDSTWIRVWGVSGTSSHPFKQVMIPVNSEFQTNSFQFRYVNWSTLSGNVDHWHLDYIYLNDNRTHADTALNDVSFITNHHSMLAEFTAMPWSHYITDSIDFMAKNMEVVYKNNHNTQYSVFYKYQVVDDNGAGATIETYPSTTSAKNALPYSTLVEPHAVYDISPTFINDFYFPPSSGQTKVFQIKNFFNLGALPDSNEDNDTVNSYQVFGNYYAYDDGSAEVGYGIEGVGSKLAHEFNIKKNDTLTGIMVHFSPITYNYSAKSFRLKVWSSLNPETEIYSQEATQYSSPIYGNKDEFITYKLDIPLYLTAGTYYFGWEKISPEFLNIGWDVNNNNSSKVHFNAVGVWQTATYPGTLMLRPTLGSYPNPTVSVKENIDNPNLFKIYPNPAQNTLNISINSSSNYHISLIDINGRLMVETESGLSTKINTSALANGIYIVRFTNNTTQQITHKKVIISK
jgi:hypothetical protein